MRNRFLQKIAQELAADPFLRAELEADLLRSIKAERPILTRLFTYGLPSIGAGILSSALLSRILSPRLTSLISVGIPAIGISAGILSGLLRAQELEKLKTDPYYRKLYLINQLRTSPFMEQLQELNLPIKLFLWRKAFGH